MSEQINCFILSAGLGERLRPITDHIPKPLLPILGIPILQYVIEKISAIKHAKIGINLHHKKEMIFDWLLNNSIIDSYNISLFFEQQLLGTGGALKNAEAFLVDNHFLVYNSDIFSDIDIARLIKYHLSGNNIATLAVHDHPEFNTLEISEDNLLKGLITKKFHASSKLLAFTGIAIYSPKFLRFLPQGVSSVVSGWMNAISAGEKIACLQFNNYNWNDIGTATSYVSTIIKTLKSDGENVYIHPSIKQMKNVELDGYLVVEKNSIIEDKGYFKNCIVLPNSHVKTNRYENCIIGDGFQIELDEKIFTGNSSTDTAVNIGHGGSERKYFRINKESKTYILMQTTHTDPDFHRQIELTKFFNSLRIPAPQLIEADYKKRQAIFEDLGDISLYSWLKIPRPLEYIEVIYRKVLDCLLLIHTKAAKHISEIPTIDLKAFDYEYLRWESDYFLERFVFVMYNIHPKDIKAVYKELDMLAAEVDSFKKGLMHRDFQSQNIIITNEETVRIIDYQSSRIGPQAYDLASILWDPYYRIEDKMRDRLLEYYINKLYFELSEQIDLTKDEFLHCLMLCRLQRHMQALGAYGFLSQVKGKRYFLKHIPEGIRLLKEDAYILKYKYPALYNLTLRI